MRAKFKDATDYRVHSCMFSVQDGVDLLDAVEKLRDALILIGTYREGQILMCGDSRLYLVGRGARTALLKVFGER